jgi:molybdenum cofactor guanylyltransferase
MTGRTAAIILAGGRSARFGRDKLVEPIDGRPMLDHIIERVRAVATDVVVVGRPDAQATEPGAFRVVGDDRPFEGPLAGLGAGLRALDPAIELVLVVGGDMPTLVQAVLARLVAGLDLHEAAVLTDDVGPRPLPMAVRRSVASLAVDRLLAEGERRLRALLGELDVEVVPQETWRLDDPEGLTLLDVDVPGDMPKGSLGRRQASTTPAGTRSCRPRGSARRG